MQPGTYTRDWRDVVVYTAPGPQPVLLVDEPDLRVIIGGLEPGAQVPEHPAPRAIYTALEGEGTFMLDGEAVPFNAGAVVVAPAGSVRGIKAITRLAFLGVRIGSSG